MSQPSNGKYPVFSASPRGIYIKIRVQPRASRSRIVGIHGDTLKIALTAPPVEGEANSALVEFLSKFLGLKKSVLTLETGQRSREKTVRIEGISIDELEKTFSANIL